MAPSDTVYGLLADATNEFAVKKLLAFKNRPSGKPVSVFVSDIQSINTVANVSNRELQLIHTMLPGPFTIILNTKHTVCHDLESERGTIGVRVPLYTFINEICVRFGKPITATSANISGKKPHYRLTSLLSQISQVKKDLLDLVVDAGQLPRNKPSTVVDLTGEDIRILRKGDITVVGTQVFISDSARDTQKLARYVIRKYIDKYQNHSKPLIFLFEGEMGAGKTAFVQGMGQELGISDIVSPTYVISYEYRLMNQIYNNFVHYDLYNLIESNEFDHIGITDYLSNKNIIAVEWAGKITPVYQKARSAGQLVSIKIEYQSETSRKITIGEVA